MDPAPFPQGSARFASQRALESRIQRIIIPYPWLSLTLSLRFAGEFKTCTILFSDVVTFTNICAACQPIQIVTMLNSMYSKFDRLTSVHEVYKVSVHLLRVCPAQAGRELGYRSSFASLFAALWSGVDGSGVRSYS